MAIQIQTHAKDWEENYKRLSWWDSESVRKAKVMVVGAGALGNEVLKNLALLNIGHLCIIDFDRIEYSNLSRSVLFREKDCEQNLYKSKVAAERIKEINPMVNIHTIEGDFQFDVGHGLISAMDVIICCVDNRLARLHINRKSFFNKKAWVNGAIENLIGQMEVYKDAHQCYECNLSETEWQSINARIGCADIAQKNIIAGRVPTTPLSASIIAAFQCQEALKIIHGLESNVMYDSNLYIEGMSNTFLQLQASAQKENCYSHYAPETVHPLSVSSKDKLEKFFQVLKSDWNIDRPILKLNHNLCLSLVNKDTDELHQVLAPDFGLNDPRYVSEQIIQIETKLVKDMVHEITPESELLEYRLESIGIPAWDILKIITEDEIRYFELAEDNIYS